MANSLQARFACGLVIVGLVTLSLAVDPPVDWRYGVARATGLAGWLLAGTGLLGDGPGPLRPPAEGLRSTLRWLTAAGLMILHLAHGLSAALAYRTPRVFLPAAGSLRSMFERGGVLALALFGAAVVFQALDTSRGLGPTGRRMAVLAFTLATLHGLLVGRDLQAWPVRVAVIVVLALVWARTLYEQSRE